MAYSPGESVNEGFRSGIIALAGRPNVGKSTLLNCLLGKKISITSRKANTTRHRILGVLSEEDHQLIFIDLPGFNPHSKRLLERSIHRSAVANIAGTDLVLFLVESRGWQDQDMMVWKKIQSENLPVVIVVNKIDRMKDKQQLLPIMKQLFGITGVSEIVPVSAKKKENTELLKSTLTQLLPHSPPLFPSDFVTDRDEKFQASELVREQIFRCYGDELPYASAVQIEKYEHTDGCLHIHALIWVENRNQKKIIIGAKGSKLKIIGRNVRSVLEKELNRKVYLKLWVKVRTQWSQDHRLVSLLGYSDFD